MFFSRTINSVGVISAQGIFKGVTTLVGRGCGVDLCWFRNLTILLNNI